MENIRYACPDERVTQRSSELPGRSAMANGSIRCRRGWIPRSASAARRLSMGQRQLVSLMRVLVQKPSIFILDEATASIDPFTEWQIQQALNLILAPIDQHLDRSPAIDG